MTSPTINLSPIRIYVIWHPGLDLPDETGESKPSGGLTQAEKTRNRGLRLARRIYHWFRMENMDGIPVYFRSAPTSTSDEMPLPITPEPGVRNYIIPLVDASMVSSPGWRRFVVDLARRDDDASKNLERNPVALDAGLNAENRCDSAECDCRVFPVAMEAVAYNMPDPLRSLNFIRHVQTSDAPPDDAELLAKLTEVLCRDLRYWLLRETRGKIAKDRANSTLPPIPRKIRIFLSHAKADDTDEALAIKEYIQRNTQCEAFFDETDIASGYDYAKILENAVTNESAGLVVIQGDNYADRPWCRKEIRDFLRPIPDPLASDDPHSQYFIPPVVVVQTMKGKQIGRTIPELGYSPCVRWNDKSAGFVVTTLLREILFGLFYRILADRIASTGSEIHEVFINRAPDPVMVSRILKDLLEQNPDAYPSQTFVHPGYGLSKMERDGLLSAVHGIRFQSFLSRTSDGPMRPSHLEPVTVGVTPPLHLAGKIISVSAESPEDILATGQGDEHMAELLARLLRPLISSGASILYGGARPDSLRPAAPWDEPLSFTALLLNQLLSEHEISDKNAARLRPRLYLPVAWHDRHTVTRRDIAQWVDICSFLFAGVDESEIDIGKIPPEPKAPDPEDFDGLNAADRKRKRLDFDKELGSHLALQAAVVAVSLSAMCRSTCQGTLEAIHPDVIESGAERLVHTNAHILIGGATEDFQGAMPGVFEEALHVIHARKPLFIVAAFGGAAAVLAKQLVRLGSGSIKRKAVDQKSTPAEFSRSHYEGRANFKRVMKGIKQPVIRNYQPGALLTQLWTELSRVRDPDTLASLLNNGLDGAENLRLMQATSFGEICGLISKAIGNLNPATKPS